LSPDDAARQVQLNLCIGGDFFMELAKFRTIRPLWARLTEAFGAGEEARKARVHARTGIYNKTVTDPWVNILRTTTEALSAVLAGIDSLCVGTFDEGFRLPDRLARRLARNTQIILMEECELDQVTDPAGGSWAVESLTDSLCQAAWSYFQQIESKGGLAASLADGWLAGDLAATDADRVRRLGQRRSSLVGTNLYPNLDEPPATVELPDYAALREERARQVATWRTGADEERDARAMQALEHLMAASSNDLMPMLQDAYAAGASLGEITRILRGGEQPPPPIEALPNRRLAVPYEELRAAAEAWRSRHGEGPKLFLCNLGPLRRHKIRADFTRGFFEAGGFRVIAGPGADAPEPAVAALMEADARIAVICGTDEDYPDQVPVFTRALKAARPDLKVVLAGHPGDREAAYREAGLDDFIFVKTDNYATNRAYLEFLGVL
jgi:methylmalonyl-CoA mutase